MRVIIDQLTKEAMMFKDLISILHRETEYLIGRDYKSLYETVSFKEQLLRRIGEAAKTRQALLNDAAQSMGLATDKSANASLAAIIDSAAPQVSEELRLRQADVISLIETVKDINKVNAQVVAESLDNIKKTLGFLGNFLPKSTYRPTGAFEDLALKGTRLSEGA